MKHFSNHPKLVQNKINTLLYAWPELDMCLEYVYELVLMLLPCYEEVFEYVKGFKKDYKCESYYLHLGYTKITDITSLATLTNLTVLYLNNTKITDTKVLDHLKPNLTIRPFET